MDVDTSQDLIFHIDWTRVPWEEWDQEKSANGDADYGVYQVYGDHPVYGPDVLLYIGMAQIRTFVVRLSETDHADFIDTHLTRFTALHLGRFIDCDDINQDNWGDAIAYAERLLINSHTPAYNYVHVKGVPEWTGPHIRVLNWGERGTLLPEVSSRRFSNHYWDNDRYPWNPMVQSRGG